MMFLVLTLSSCAIGDVGGGRRCGYRPIGLMMDLMGSIFVGAEGAV
jgi:hypothetical protein